jgi:hypothetical protein
MDLSKHLTDSRFDGHRIWWTYEFPNGHSASVIPDPRPASPFRFEVESSDPQDVITNPITTTVGAGVVCGLTTDEVEAKLAKLAALPQNEDAA